MGSNRMPVYYTGKVNNSIFHLASPSSIFLPCTGFCPFLRDTIAPMFNFKSIPLALRIGLALVGLALLGLIVYQIPAVKTRLDWRMDIARTYLRGVINPAGPMPTSADTLLSVTL